MTRPFFKRDRISDFELFDRYSADAISQVETRLREGYPIDFQVCSWRLDLPYVFNIYRT
jgi:hypothetical protein